VAFLVDGKHIVSGGAEQQIRRWRVDDGMEVATPIMDAGSPVRGVVATRDGKWVVSGTSRGVVVWNAKTREKVSEFKGQGAAAVCAVDVSPGSTRIATGSEDGTAGVWSLSAGERLVGPFKLRHDYPVVGVKFSPRGGLIATATQRGNNPVCIYDSRNGDLLVDFSVQVGSLRNQSLSWASESKLFALSSDGDICCLDVSTGTMLSHWPIHSSSGPQCIAVANNGAFIAASGDFSVSFWDTTTHRSIGSIQHANAVESLAISSKYDFVIGGGREITLRSLFDFLPLRYCKDVSAFALKA
jgi:WD40 repeat protein